LVARDRRRAVARERLERRTLAGTDGASEADGYRLSLLRSVVTSIASTGHFRRASGKPAALRRRRPVGALVLVGRSLDRHGALVGRHRVDFAAAVQGLAGDGILLGGKRRRRRRGGGISKDVLGQIQMRRSRDRHLVSRTA